MKILRSIAILLAVGLIFLFGFGYGRWYSTRPANSQDSRKILYYVDPMHPWYKSDKPGIAPDCGMKLVPVYASNLNGTPRAQSTSVMVDTEQQHLSGVRYGTAEWSTGADSIHANGRVTPDETRIVKVQARLDGWVTRTMADFAGKFVAKGEALLVLNSPELLSAEQEYLLALRARMVMQHSSMEESASNSNSMADAARQRLRLLAISDAQIKEIERTQTPNANITLYSPASGYIMARNVFPGQRVTPETEFYTLADLRTVWVMADVFEENAARVKAGQAARISIPGRSEPVTAKVSYLQPQVDANTRTMKVRLDVQNPAMQLRPDMWVDVDIDLPGIRRLSVPAGAVLDSGTTKTIFVDRGNGRLEQRTVETGARFNAPSGDRIEIVKGLTPDERIAISGTFLLNSESQMKSAGAQP